MIPGLLREVLRRRAVGHHEEPGGLHAQVAGGGEVLRRDVRLGAVGGHAHHARTRVAGPLEVLDRADPGHEEHRDRRLLRLLAGGRDELHLVGAGEAVVERAAAQAVAVGHLDHLDARPVERAHRVAHLRLGELVGHRVAAVAQGGVDDADVVRQLRAAHANAPCLASAICSPTWAAAAVMMSRLPA
jgi:hypothetical protein